MRRANQSAYPYNMKVLDMTQRYRKFKRSWGMWYAFDTVTGNSVSLKTRVKTEAVRKTAAMNESEHQPSITLGLAKVYLNATDPKLATRTWQEVMEHIVAKKTDETKHRWETAIKDRNFDCIRKLHVAETRPEHFDKALADGKVSSNVYLRRITIMRWAWNGCCGRSSRACNGRDRCSSRSGLSPPRSMRQLWRGS